jgi:hypothetical protein
MGLMHYGISLLSVGVDESILSLLFLQGFWIMFSL